MSQIASLRINTREHNKRGRFCWLLLIMDGTFCDGVKIIPFGNPKLLGHRTFCEGQGATSKGISCTSTTGIRNNRKNNIRTFKRHNPHVCSDKSILKSESNIEEIENTPPSIFTNKSSSEVTIERDRLP